MPDSNTHSEMFTVLFSLGATAAFLAVMVWAVVWLGGFMQRCPKHLRIHFIVALIWTAVTGIQTACIVAEPGAKLVPHLVVFIAGATMVASWKRWCTRRRWEMREKSGLLPVRLYLQTFWGLMALGGLVLWLVAMGERHFYQALVKRDIPTVLLLREYGFGDADGYLMRKGLSDGIEQQDVAAVATYLAAGTHTRIYNQSYYSAYGYGDRSSLASAVERDNTAITELLLEHGDPVNQTEPGTGKSLLHLAVKSGQQEQVRVLLRHGANRTARDVYGRTPFEVAKISGNQKIAALLAQPALSEVEARKD